MDVRSDEVVRGVRQRIGSIVGASGPIPMVLWTPESGVADHLILAGHGGSGHKLEEYIVSLATGMVRHQHVAVVSIDGPVHGDRLPGVTDEAQRRLEFGRAWSSDPHFTDGMVRDWQDTLDAALSMELLAPGGRVGYWGLSMGTILGLPFVAAEPRVGAAVLGLMGVTGPTKDRLATDATRVTVPTFFLAQWDDQLVKREEALALFDAIAATDKTLVVTPGPHAAVTPENFRRSAEFLADRLGAVG